MQLDPAIYIMNTLQNIHFYLQLVTEQSEWMKNKKFHKEQYAALNKHVLLQHIERIN